MIGLAIGQQTRERRAELGVKEFSHSEIHDLADLYNPALTSSLAIFGHVTTRGQIKRVSATDTGCHGNRNTHPKAAITPKRAC
jgi:hypothetical protein